MPDVLTRTAWLLQSASTVQAAGPGASSVGSYRTPTHTDTPVCSATSEEVEVKLSPVVTVCTNVDVQLSGVSQSSTFEFGVPATYAQVAVAPAALHDPGVVP